MALENVLGQQYESFYPVRRAAKIAILLTLLKAEARCQKLKKKNCVYEKRKARSIVLLLV